MLSFLKIVRKPLSPEPLTKQWGFSMLILVVGLALGVIVKILDIYTQNLGNVFSQMSIWIFICTIIATNSYSPQRASINVFLFSVGMFVTYYITAQITQSIYSIAFIYGWGVFCLCTPVFAFFTWYSKGKGWFKTAISCGVLLFIILCAIIMFDRIRFSDILILLLTMVYLFFIPVKNDCTK
jgi:hypothetical protein